MAQRVVLTLLLLQERPRSAIDLMHAVFEAMGNEAYRTRPIYALRRDIQCLREAGFTVRYARAAGAYRLEQSPLTVGLGESGVRALALVRQAFQPGVPHADEVQALVARLAELLPEAEQRLLARTPAVRFDLAPADSGPKSGSLVERLERAISLGVQARFRYASPRASNAAELVVEPWELTYRQGHLYLQAYSLKAEQPREYRVDRIEPGSLEVLTTRRPPGRQSPKRYRLRYRLSATVARLGVSKRFPGQEVELLPDGSALVSAEIESLFWAERTLLQYGEHVEVLGPPELREAIRSTSEWMVRIYAEEGY